MDPSVVDILLIIFSPVIIVILIIEGFDYLKLRRRIILPSKQLSKVVRLRRKCIAEVRELSHRFKIISEELKKTVEAQEKDLCK